MNGVFRKILGGWGTFIGIAAIVGLDAILTTTNVCGAVKTYPAPAGQAVDGVYSIRVDGEPVDVYSAWDEQTGKSEYYFASFDFDESVKIEISSQLSLENALVGPESSGVKVAEQSEKSLKLEADKPFKIAVEPNGLDRPLLLFGNAFEENAPKEGDPNVIYFGPGVHKPGKIVVSSGQTVYLAPGAVVKGGIRAEGENITICGRGVLGGEDWERFKGPNEFIIFAVNCKNLVVCDVVLRNPWSWTLVTNDCDGVEISGVKICGSRMINDDALDLCNTRNAVVRDCFFRTQDDSIAIKGLISTPSTPCEKIWVEDCVFWTDRANIFRIGYECQTDAMREIYAKNIDILHYSVDYRDPSHYWANALIWLQPNQGMLTSDCRFENFRVRSNGADIIVLMAKPMSCSYGEFENPTPGRLENCSFKDFSVYGERGSFVGTIFIQGASQKSNVDGLKFENISFFGTPVDKSSSNVIVGEHTKNVAFDK